MAGSRLVGVLVLASIVGLVACGGHPAPTAPAAQTKPTAPSISSFTVEPATIAAGQTATLSWTVSSATRVTIDPGIGDVPSSGTRSVTPAQSTTYALKAYGEGDTMAQKSVAITVTAAKPASISSFTAQPSTAIDQGIVLSWVVLDATRVTIEPGMGEVPLTGTRTISRPQATTTFQLTAFAADGTSVQRSVVVAAPAPPVIIDTFEVDRPCIGNNSTSQLMWAVYNADRVTISEIGEVRSAGTYTLRRGQRRPFNETYTLTAYGPEETQTRQVQVRDLSDGTAFDACVSGVPAASILTEQRLGTSFIVHDSIYNVPLPWYQHASDSRVGPGDPLYLAATSASPTGCITVQMFINGTLLTEAQSCGPYATAAVSGNYTLPPGFSSFARR